MNIVIKHISDKHLVINPKAREWCKLAYPGHKNGCPNFGKRNDCPPKVSVLQKVVDLNRKLCLVIVRFNLRNHMKRMKQLHPEWSDRQARCVLYWQNSVRKRQKETVRQMMKKYGFDFWTDKPEAMGVQVILTCNNLGIPIKTKPTKYVYKVALIGFRKSNQKCISEFEGGK